MKKILVVILAFLALNLQAQQKNIFLDQAFWKTGPDVATIQAEIAKGNDPSELTNSAFDPVVYAINAKAPSESVKFLLAQKGNTVSKLTHDGRTYLFWAALRGDIPVVEYLLSKGASTTVEDTHGTTPITFAASGGQADTKVYDAFIKSGADIKAVNHDGANVLLLAIANDKDLVLTDYFISKGLSLQSTDAAGNTAFNYVARTGNVALLNKLIEKGVKYTDNAMIMAAQGGRGGSNPLAFYQYLEGLAIKPTVRNSNGENVLHLIARRPNQKDVISYFIAKGVDVNQPDNDGNTPFMNAAASNRDTATITLLLESLKNINQVNKKGVSALAMSVRGNSPAIIQLLITKGADKNITDAEGNNLGYYVLQSYNQRTAEEFDPKIKVLQDNGFALNTPQKNGNTLYHLAIIKNDLSLLKRLEPLHIDVNGKNKEGLTALHRAAMVSRDDVIMKYLLSIGAKKEVTTDFKETAFDLAKENEFLTKNNVRTDFLK